MKKLLLILFSIFLSVQLCSGIEIRQTTTNLPPEKGGTGIIDLTGGNYKSLKVKPDATGYELTIAVQSYTTTERNALTNVPTDLIIYNSTDTTLQKYNGATWDNVGDGIVKRTDDVITPTTITDKLATGLTDATANIESKVDAKTGTGTLTSSGTAVLGNGTSFTTELTGNNKITADGETRRIISISDDTHLAVDLAWTSSLSSDAFTYSIQSGKFGGASNYSEFEADGHLNLVGDAQPWSDIDIVITEKSGAGIDSPDYILFKDNGSGSQGVFNYAFSPTAEEELFFEAKIPHDYAEGSDMDFHLHWSPSTANAGDVVWAVEYVWTEKNGTATNTTITSSTITSDGVAFRHQVDTIIPTLSGTGRGIGGIISGRIYRIADAAADDYADDAFLLAADFHYQVDGFGTRNVGTK